MTDAENEAYRNLIGHIANLCINDNLHRVGNTFHYLDVDTLNNLFFSTMPHLHLLEAYCFLDEPGGDKGMLKIVTVDMANPKFSFCVDANDTISYAGA
jgi:hypothetical protein